MSTPSDQHILERVSTVVAETLGDSQLVLEPEMTAADVESWDSVAHVEILIALEAEFGIRFRTSELGSLANIGELVRRIQARLSD